MIYYVKYKSILFHRATSMNAKLFLFYATFYGSLCKPR